MLTETPQVDEPRGQEYGCGVSGADCLVVVMKRGNARGAKGTGHSRHDRCGQLATGGTARSLRRERQLSLNGKSRVSREAQARFREGLCHEDAKASCCTKDEGGPFETGL
jgi:hypothetical protein